MDAFVDLIMLEWSEYRGLCNKDIVNQKGNTISDDPETGDKYRKITCSTQRNDNVVKRILMKLNQDPLMFEVVDKATGGTENTVIMSLNSHGPSSYDMLVANTGLRWNTIRNSVCRLRKAGKVRTHHKDGPYVYLEAI